VLGIIGGGYCVLLREGSVYACECSCGFRECKCECEYTRELREYEYECEYVCMYIWRAFFCVLSVLLSLSCNLMYILSILSFLRINILLHLCSFRSRRSLVQRSPVSAVTGARSFSIRPFLCSRCSFVQRSPACPPACSPVELIRVLRASPPPAAHPFFGVRSSKRSPVPRSFGVRSSSVRPPLFSVRRSLVLRPIPCYAFAVLLPEGLPPGPPLQPIDS